MVEKWLGGMNGSGLVLLIAILLEGPVSVLANTLQIEPYSDIQFQDVLKTRLNNEIIPHKTLYYKESSDVDDNYLDVEANFVDAQWTAEPKVGEHKVQTNISRINNQNDEPAYERPAPIHGNSKEFLLETLETIDASLELEQDLIDDDIEVTTPYMKSDGTPMTTEIDDTVTEATTQPITTEIDYDVTVNVDEEEMLRRMHRRWRRAIIAVTITAQAVAPTSVAPGDCTGDSYPNANTDASADEDDSDNQGPCSCPFGMTGVFCDEELPLQTMLNMDSITFSGDAQGEYDDSDRTEIERALREKFKNYPWFYRVYVHPITYNTTSNTSNIQFSVIFNTGLTPDDWLQLTSIVTGILSGVTPIKVNDLQVLWYPQGSVTVTDDDGTIRSIPVSVDDMRGICYLYNELQVCGKNGGGFCVNDTGEPVCTCTLGYHGKYCEALIVYIDDWKTQLVAVLIPVLIGTAALVFLCSCCFAFFRRVNRGDREAVSVSSDIPPVSLAVPKLFFRDTGWPQLTRVPCMVEGEELVAEYRGVIVEEWECEEILEIHKEIIEPEYVYDQILREPVYRYYSYCADRPEIEYTTITESSVIKEQPSSTSTTATYSVSTSTTDATTSSSWMYDAKQLGDDFHIDRPEVDEANDIYIPQG